MVPLMMSILHVPMKLTSGTSLIAVMIPRRAGHGDPRCSATSTGSPHRRGLRLHPRSNPGLKLILGA